MESGADRQSNDARERPPEAERGLAAVRAEMEKAIAIPPETRARWDAIVWAEIEASVLLAVNHDASFQNDPGVTPEEIVKHRREVEEWLAEMRRMRGELVELETRRRLRDAGWERVGKRGRKNRKSRSRYRARKAAGLCVKCPEGAVRPASKDQATCDECAEADRVAKAHRRRRERIEGGRQRREARKDPRTGNPRQRDGAKPRLGTTEKGE